MNYASPTTSSPESIIVDPAQLLKKQLAEWQELNSRLSEQNAIEPNHERYNDLVFCQGMIESLELDIQRLAHHFE